MERKWFNTFDCRDGGSVSFDANTVVGVSEVKFATNSVYSYKVTLGFGLTVPLDKTEFAKLKEVIGYPFGEFKTK